MHKILLFFKHHQILKRFGVKTADEFYQKLIWWIKEYPPKLEENINFSQDDFYDIVKNSNLWDEKYYLTQNLESKNQDPLENYLSSGWKKGYNPSPFFDGNLYLKEHPTIRQNPLIHFLTIGRYHYMDLPCNLHQPKENIIQDYWSKKSKNKKVIYTCITNDYDDLNEIKAYTYTPKDWDYICFTDNQDLLNKKIVGIWQCRPLAYNKLDPTRNNRYHKIFPHILLSEYLESIYLDANINILTPFLFDEIKLRNTFLLLPKHASSKSLYDEYRWALEKNIDNRWLIMSELEEIMKTGMPFNYGKPECNIIYRKHNSDQIKEMMSEWWFWVKNFSKRDQLSFSFILWKHHIKPQDIMFPNSRIWYKNFCVFIHKKKRRN